MLEEFRKFALKGNVVDLAVGVIIGAAFSQIVTSLVQDVVMPVIGFVTGGLDFSNYFFQLTGEPAATYAQAKAAGATIGYGQFITIGLNFMIVAWILFLAVRGINRLRKAEEEKPAPVADVPREQKLLEEIRDLLAVQKMP
ncbi:large conductance mechanosensitive channel protein MscL [Terrihabitans sp. B22-R8]|uniref:large conductance mechanosensitive channel protein MscL n=1 Tax=Terrihabitans sp. B22-R8 TaxID=3425128 RepID=UPI00403D24F2